MDDGVWEVPPCCLCVQGGSGCPLRLYGVSLVVSAIGDQDVGGRQLIHLGGVRESAGDSDLGGVVFAGGGERDNVAGRPFVVKRVFRPVQFEWGVDWFFAPGDFLGISRAALLWS